MKRKAVSLILALLLCATSGFAVTAYATNESGWIELLEVSSVHSNGENWFTVAGTSGSVTIPIQGEKRLRKIDMLLWNPSGQRFTSATVTANGVTNTLEVFAIGGNMSRVVGYIPNAWYEELTVDFKKSTTSSQTYEVLSCKITPVGVQDFVCDATVNIDGTDYSIAQQIDIAGNGLSENAYSQIRIDIRDWYKYDSLTIWGSCLTMGLSSVRATVTTLGLPFEMSYFQTLPTGEVTDYTYRYTYTENYSGGGGYGNGYGDTSTAIEYNGKVFFCLTIDLTGVDRSLTTTPLYVYLTGVYSGLYGYTFNCQYVNGSVETADTTSVTWWGRFTEFMTGLFSKESDKADDFAQDAESQKSELDQMNEQLEAVTKPPVEDIETDISSYIDSEDSATVASAFRSFASNPLVLTMMMITLTVALVGYILFGKR